jgi:hypothetical protein
MSRPDTNEELARRLDHVLERRALLGAALLGTVGVVVGCGSSSGSSAASTSPSTSDSPSTSLVPSPSAGSASPTAVATKSSNLPTTQPWTPTSAEIDPQVKVQATRVLEAIGAWGIGEGGAVAARKRVAALGQSPSLVADAPGLLPDADAAAIQVSIAQYGGILSSSSSVLVVLEQWLQDSSGKVTKTGTTVDVRLVKASPHWKVTALHPAAPGRAVSSLSSAARAVLSSSRIALPYAATADVKSGLVHDSVMTALLGLAKEHTIDVSVMKSGHPIYVFGTSRLSDHPRGRAVDIHAVDGKTVLDPANRALVERTMREARALGPWQIGGPVDLDGSGSFYFSDNTHHDHIHLGFST